MSKPLADKEEKPLKGRIKIGAKIYQDKRFLTWPDCLPPRKNRVVDPEMVFFVTWVSSGNGGYWDCVAPGYGQLGTGDTDNYGNGSIYVYDKEGVELVDSSEEVKPLLADESSIDISPTPLTKEEVEAYIVKEQYHQFPGTLHTVCCLTLKNGYTVVGENVCAHEEYFDQEYAKVDSKEKALEKVWGLVGFLKKSYP